MELCNSYEHSITVLPSPSLRIGSGESGAGKTETCKFIVRELVELSHGKSVLEQKILQVNNC